jgi:hypothetical protein
MCDLEDLSYVEMVGLIDVIVRSCTTRAGRPNEPVSLVENSPLKPETFHRLQSTPFVTRLVLQISTAKPDPPTSLATHLSWENNHFTDRLIDEIFASVRARDFFDFYAGIKILQQILLNVRDSLHEYRVILAMPRLVTIARENQSYYKATELCIKSFIHLVQHVPAVADWCKKHQEDVKWMDAWLGKNKAMPKVNKDGSAVDGPAEGVALFAVKGGKHEGVHDKWEKNWNDQIEEYGVGVGAMDNLTDYQKIWKKMILAVKLRK